MAYSHAYTLPVATRKKNKLAPHNGVLFCKANSLYLALKKYII